MGAPPQLIKPAYTGDLCLLRGLRKQKQKRPNNSSVTVKPMDRTKKNKTKDTERTHEKTKII